MGFQSDDLNLIVALPPGMPEFVKRLLVGTTGLGLTPIQTFLAHDWGSFDFAGVGRGVLYHQCAEPENML